MNPIEEMANYSLKIYEDKNDSNFFFSSKNTDLQVGIYITDKIVIAFRGTESIKDGMYDIMIRKKSLNCGSKVHTGFYDQLFNSDIYNAFKNKVLELIRNYYNYEIFITGHSLGGSLATLFGYILSCIVNKHINIISFASPRVGNYRWYKNFTIKENLSHIRVVLSTDPIPLFPFFNYFHTSTCMKIKTGRWFYRVNDHRMKTYIDILQNDKLDLLF